MPQLYRLRRVTTDRQPAHRKQRLALFRCAVFALPALSGGVFAGSAEQDLANERFYTPPAAMEQHWKVDCSTLEHRIGIAFGADAATPGRTPEMQSLSDELRKCAMIYNTPGTTKQHGCPSYAASHAYLQQWLDPQPATPHSSPPSSTAALQLILQQLHCALPQAQAQ